MKPINNYQTLFKGKFLKEQIVLHQIFEEKTYPDYLNKLINSTWETEIKENNYLYNGDCYSLLNVEQSKGAIICQVQKTNYKSLFGTNIKNIALINNKEEMANALAACVVIETSDNLIIVGRRNAKMAEFVSLWHVIGGTLESYGEVPEHPFDLIIKEIKEELAVPESAISDLYCMGMAVPECNNKPEFLFYCKIIQSSEQVKLSYQSAKDKYEHEEICFIKLTDFYDFVKDKCFSPVGRAAIEFKLSEENRG